MRIIDVLEVYERGLRDFALLEPLERDFFVVHDLHLYHEMEGGAGYFLSRLHSQQVAWLKTTLERIGDRESLSLVARLERLAEEAYGAASDLADQYYGLADQRCCLLERYLRSHGAALSH